MYTCCEKTEHHHGPAGRFIAAWAPAVALCLLAQFLAFSYVTGRVRFFLAPSYYWLTLAAACVLAAMWLGIIWATFRRRVVEAVAVTLLIELLVLSTMRPELPEFVAFDYVRTWIETLLYPRYVVFFQIAAAVLVVLCAIRLRGPHEVPGGCGCQSSSAKPAATLACVALLLVPVGMILKVNPTQFSVEGVRKRQAKMTARDPQIRQAIEWVLGINKAAKSADGNSVELPKNPTILDLLNASAEVLPEDLEGRFVNVVGQCDLAQGPESSRFDLYRLVVTCCIADATSVSIEIARGPNMKLDPGQWVRVGGTLKFDSSFDPSSPVVDAKMISKIPEPSKPYL